MEQAAHDNLERPGVSEARDIVAGAIEIIQGLEDTYPEHAEAIRQAVDAELGEHGLTLSEAEQQDRLSRHDAVLHSRGVRRAGAAALLGTADPVVQRKISEVVRSRKAQRHFQPE